MCARDARAPGPTAWPERAVPGCRRPVRGPGSADGATVRRTPRPARVPSIRLAGQLDEQMGRRLDAAVEIGDREFLVGSVEIIVVLAPAQEQSVHAQVLLDEPDYRDRAPLAHEHGPG